MLWSFVVSLFLCSLHAISAIQFGRHRVFESLAEVPAGWTQSDPAPQSQKVDLRFVLAQPRMHEFEQLALNIATPGHAQYGQHLTRKEVDGFAHPTDETVTKVTSWLYAAGFSSDDVANWGRSIGVTTNVSRAEVLLQTKYHIFSDGKTNIIRALQYSLPISLHEHIHFAQPTTRFAQSRQKYHSIKASIPVPMPPKPLWGDPDKCNQLMTPICARYQYNYDVHTEDRLSNNTVGVAGFLDQYPSKSDLTKFVDTFSPYPGFSLNFTFHSVNGGQDPQNSPLNSEKANLDIQYVTAFSIDAPVHFYSTAGRGPLVPDLDQPDGRYSENAPLFEQLEYFLGLPDDQLPKVLSTSYSEDEQSIPLDYANVTCNMIAQLGSRGVSVIVASGDTGVGSGCQTNDGHQTTRFLPTFPATCPWVTSVGGTNGFSPEVAVGFSSGGFSDYFGRWPWQEQMVSGYLSELGNRWNGLYQPLGRGVPDVAARSVKCYFYDHGQLRAADGTGCATAIFAGIVSYLNSLRLKNDLNSLGFLNPFLYKTPSALNDITLGGSSGCQGTDMYSGLPGSTVPYASWNATGGWDPVTGLGSPNVDKLVAAMGTLNS